MNLFKKLRTIVLATSALAVLSSYALAAPQPIDPAKIFGTVTDIKCNSDQSCQATPNIIVSNFSSGGFSGSMLFTWKVTRGCVYNIRPSGASVGEYCGKPAASISLQAIGAVANDITYDNTAVINAALATGANLFDACDGGDKFYAVAGTLKPTASGGIFSGCGAGFATDTGKTIFKRIGSSSDPVFDTSGVSNFQARDFDIDGGGVAATGWLAYSNASAGGNFGNWRDAGHNIDIRNLATGGVAYDLGHVVGQQFANDFRCEHCNAFGAGKGVWYVGSTATFSNSTIGFGDVGVRVEQGAQITLSNSVLQNNNVDWSACNPGLITSIDTAYQNSANGVVLLDDPGSVSVCPGTSSAPLQTNILFVGGDMHTYNATALMQLRGSAGPLTMVGVHPDASISKNIEGVNPNYPVNVCSSYGIVAHDGSGNKCYRAGGDIAATSLSTSGDVSPGGALNIGAFGSKLYRDGATGEIVVLNTQGVRSDASGAGTVLHSCGAIGTNSSGAWQCKSTVASLAATSGQTTTSSSTGSVTVGLENLSAKSVSLTNGQTVSIARPTGYGRGTYLVSAMVWNASNPSIRSHGMWIASLFDGLSENVTQIGTTYAAGGGEAFTVAAANDKVTLTYTGADTVIAEVHLVGAGE